MSDDKVKFLLMVREPENDDSIFVKAKCSQNMVKIHIL